MNKQNDIKCLKSDEKGLMQQLFPSMGGMGV